ncbi:MAG: PGF-pre-PGF domain-containing protein [Methanoregula sp.]|nr:PGF-pre-PGF domain-containing protein [Methanoregula sp.]
MKRLKKFRGDKLSMKRDILILSLMVIFLAVPIVSAQDINITQPSTNETLLAEMRDFYVYGIYPAAVTNPGDIKIEVFPGDSATGTPIRVVQSQVDPVTGITNESVIDTTYANGTRKNNVMVPDLVKAPGSILDTTNKVVVTNYYYMGLILGGVTKDFDTNYKDGTGLALTDLKAGNYTIKVTGLSGNLAGQVASETVTFGLTNATLGSFRNIPNKNAMIQYTITHNRRTYFDWFPGYFTDPIDSNKWYEAPQRWTPNNGIEVVNDRPGTLIDTSVVANNTMFIYNINSASATYGVELASILKYNLQDNQNTTFLYYENGEPVLTYNDSRGAPQQVTSALRQFSGSSRLALTRLEVRDPASISFENLYDPNDTTWKWAYTDLSGTISINKGQTFTIYGVAKPIPSTVSSTSTPYRFAINNRTSYLVCNITDANGNLVLTSTHEVNLSRYYNNYPGSSNPYQKFNSLFEFGSEFTTLNTPGTYTIFLNGTDVSGSTVTGATATFTVHVLPGALPDGGSDNAPPSGNPQVVIKPGAHAKEPIFFAFTVPSATGNMAVLSVMLYPSHDIGEVECIVQPVTPGTPLQITDRAVAGYESITMNWINPGAINYADIMFSVNRAWLTEHALAPDDVVMLRYADNQWTELPTKLDHTTDEMSYYIATTPGFSYFAIADKARATGASVNGTVTAMGSAGISSAKSTSTVQMNRPAASVPTGVLTLPPTPVLTPVVSPAQLTVKDLFFPNHGPALITIVVWAVVILIIIIAIILIRRWWIRRQNPSLFRKYD